MRRRDEARADRVDAHAFRRKAGRHGARHRDDAALGRRIGVEPGLADQRIDGGGEDDRARLCARASACATYFAVRNVPVSTRPTICVPGLLRQFGDAAVVLVDQRHRDRVVEQNVDAAEAADRRRRPSPAPKPMSRTSTRQARAPRRRRPRSPPRRLRRPRASMIGHDHAVRPPAPCSSQPALPMPEAPPVISATFLGQTAMS